MDTAVIVVLVIVGAGITIYGLAKAYIDARRQVSKEQGRIDRTQALMARERTALNSIPNDREHEAERNEAQAMWNGLYAAEGLQRASWANLSQLSQFETLRLVRELLMGARTNLLIAGFGVLVSTAASVWDIARG